MLRSGLSAGLVFSLSLLAVAAQGDPNPRLEWQPEACQLSWHRNCAFAADHGTAEASSSHRFVTLQAQLVTFAPEDASIYAVYLSDREDLEHLQSALRDGKSPRPGEPSATLSDPNGVTVEWLTLEPNGRITVRADEAHQSGKTWVAVVNADGELLGAHPLWAAHGDLAELR